MGTGLDATLDMGGDSRSPLAARLLAVLWQRKLVVFAWMMVGVGLAVAYLNIARQTYSTELRVTAAASSSNAISNRLGNLGGLAAVAGLPLGGSNKAEPFDLWIEALHSRQVADVLARDPRIMRTIFEQEWDATRSAWRQPSPGVLSAVRTVIGLPPKAWRAPDGARLQAYLQKEVVVGKNAKSPITVIGYRSEDPEFGTYLLQKLYVASDGVVRARSLAQAKDYRDYLTSVLPTVELADVRQSLASALADQYEIVMMASSSTPYAALQVGAPQASLTPTSPKVAISLLLGLLLGLFVGVAAALIDVGATLRQIRAAPAPIQA